MAADSPDRRPRSSGARAAGLPAALALAVVLCLSGLAERATAQIFGDFAVPPPERAEPRAAEPAAPRHAPTRPAAAPARLRVQTEPSAARVRIMNIGPSYRAGMELAPGRYDLQVSAPGYRTHRGWYRLESGEQTLRISLEQVPAGAPAGGGSREAFEPTLVRISGGCYQMGSPTGEAGRDDDERQHRVCVDDFKIGQYEVTVGEFKRFVAATGYRTDAERNAGGRTGCRAFENDAGWDWRGWASWREPVKGQTSRDDHPVACVSWNDAQAYIEWLNGRGGGGYRLPTEAEWEYAARAGSTAARYWGADEAAACRHANVADSQYWADGFPCKDGFKYTAPVGRFAANAWGLYDMLGNVREWTCSAYDKAYGGAEQRCSSKNDAGSRAYRGGSWSDPPRWVRSAYRYRTAPDYRYDYLGFRLAQD